MKKLLIIIAFAEAVVSCGLIEPEDSRSTEMVVRSMDIGNVKTKAGREQSLRIFEDQSKGLALYEYVSDMDDDRILTKGNMIGRNNISTSYGRFTVDGYLETDTEDSHFIKGTACAYSEGKWFWQDAESPLWRNGIKTVLWSYAPYGKDYSFIVDTGNIRTAGLEYVSRNNGISDFTNSYDLLVAFNDEMRHFDENGDFKEGETNGYDTKFYHSLAALKFGLTVEGVGEGVDIRRITVSGLYDSGRCDIFGNGEGSGAVEFDWKTEGERSSFTENVDIKKLQEGYCTSGDGVLFIVPQNPDNVQITVEFLKNGHNIVKTLDISAPDGGWQAGKSYTYLLKAIVHTPGEEVEIDYSFSVKGFKNAGGIHRIGPFETSGARKIGIVLSQNYKERSGFGSAEYYVENNDGSKNSKEDDIFYDYLPLPEVESSPYAGGDNVPEHYFGAAPVTGGGTDYHVFDVTGYGSFYIVCHSFSSANDGRWSGIFQKLYFLDVE